MAMRSTWMAALAVAFILLTGCGQMANPAEKSGQSAVGAPEARVIVYLSGFVQQPGTYRVPLGTSVKAVIDLAGGFRPGADDRAIDLNAAVVDTTQIFVPRVGEPKQGQPLLAKETAGQTASKADRRILAGTSSPEIKVYRSLPAGACAAEEGEMLQMINRERTSRGLSPLVMDARLVRSARLKSQDMADNGYFAHQSPRYGSPSAMISEQGVSYHFAGENIAAAGSVAEAHSGLMGSPGHRQNILLPQYTMVGIGIVKSGSRGLIITQHFAGD